MPQEACFTFLIEVFQQMFSGVPVRQMHSGPERRAIQAQYPGATPILTAPQSANILQRRLPVILRRPFRDFEARQHAYLVSAVEQGLRALGVDQPLNYDSAKHPVVLFVGPEDVSALSCRELLDQARSSDELLYRLLTVLVILGALKRYPGLIGVARERKEEWEETLALRVGE